jgi:methylmalonyl-CoA mutase N-terminal domain/subunit
MERDEAEVRRTLAAMIEVARGSGNMVGPMLDAIRAEATLGEVCGALKDEWGEYREPARF